MNLYERSYFSGPCNGEGFYLVKDNWNDFGYETLFVLHYYDGETNKEIGGVKIGNYQNNSKTNINDLINGNNENVFSLGNGKDYYLNLNKLNNEKKLFILKEMNDIAYDLDLFERIKDLDITKESLLRWVSPLTIKGQFNRIIENKVELTSFEFTFNNDEFKIDFEIEPKSKPQTNLQGIIGNNGIGKTKLLKDILVAFIKNDTGSLYNKESEDELIFANALLVSFSIFDDNTNILKHINNNKNTKLNYIGVQKWNDDKLLNKSNEELANEFCESVEQILKKSDGSDERWDKIVELLNIEQLELNLSNIDELKKDDKEEFEQIFKALSSGQKIVILTLTKMIEHVVEKTLILIDEPEMYLHPPLLASYMRAISKLLIEQNGVGIIATHSPIVMQELRRDCINIVKGFQDKRTITKPRIETYGENVGSLIREVFGLEVEKTGYYQQLLLEVEAGKNYEELVEEYQDSIGKEAKSILRVLIKHRGDIND
ncbi:AAA family ATPase [Staphylococcus sp. 18_1_E_LY]|uniref:AAA family ATPase n=1 Tax=Staphylococcus lloydii TaxID=2781774 RepID=A0A7T1F9G7_9STAP|nr:AAA family ATPase [Staphylococcus lloydii]MBF7019884.1 AAA family ATPase [Staphylococcus lloydii]MBF7027567.1 AAA family ATPase [Staphylococcus lloydii]QPM75255.1 AAA family ATPase [Staphylococcus lloydii]